MNPTVNVTGLNEDAVQEFLRVAARIAARNGNRHGLKRTLVQITENLRDHRCCPGMPFRGGKTTSLLGQYSSYLDKASIFIHPDQPRPDRIDTLVHEVAHHHASGSHNKAWRRMYAMLLAAAQEIFGIPDLRVRRAFRTCAERYVRPDRDNTYQLTAPEFIPRQTEMRDTAVAEMVIAHAKATGWVYEWSRAVAA